MNFTDNLPQERIKQRIQELEQSLISESKFFALLFIQQPAINDPWTNSDINLPTADTDIEDFSVNHDHYLYGVDKK